MTVMRKYVLKGDLSSVLFVEGSSIPRYSTLYELKEFIECKFNIKVKVVVNNCSGILNLVDYFPYATGDASWCHFDHTWVFSKEKISNNLVGFKSV